MFEPINIKATLVALNYSFLSAAEFREKLEEKDILNKYKLTFVEDAVEIKGEIPPQQILNDIKEFFPIVYASEDATIKIIYTQKEFKLVIDKKNLSQETYQDFANLSNDIIDLKLSDLSAVGMNYSAEFNLSNLKLNLLNNQIIDYIPDFQNNLTFEFVLPINYEEKGLISTYRIRKLKGGDNTGLDRIYAISVNNHFNISEYSTADKAKKLDEILSVDLFNEFLNKSQNFLRLNDGKN